MPCPHNEISIVQRSQQQSAVAAAAIGDGKAIGGHFPFCVKGDNQVLQVYITFRIAAHDTANGDIHILQQGIGSLQTGCRVMISGNDDNLQRRVFGRNFS